MLIGHSPWTRWTLCLTSASAPWGQVLHQSWPETWLGWLGPPGTGPVRRRAPLTNTTRRLLTSLCLSLNNISMNTAADVTNAAAPSPSPARATQTPRRYPRCTDCLNVCPLPALPAGSRSPDGMLARTAARTERRNCRRAECAGYVWLLAVTHRLAE